MTTLAVNQDLTPITTRTTLHHDHFQITTKLHQCDNENRIKFPGSDIKHQSGIKSSTANRLLQQWRLTITFGRFEPRSHLEILPEAALYLHWSSKRRIHQNPVMWTQYPMPRRRRNDESNRITTASFRRRFDFLRQNGVVARFLMPPETVGSVNSVRVGVRYLHWGIQSVAHKAHWRPPENGL